MYTQPYMHAQPVGEAMAPAPRDGAMELGGQGYSGAPSPAPAPMPIHSPVPIQQPVPAARDGVAELGGAGR